MKYKIYVFLFTILTALSTQSCGPVTIMMDQTPELRGGSPLRGIKPLKFVITDFGDEVGDVVFSGTPGTPFPVVKIDKPAPIIIAKAVAAELRRNGHEVFHTQYVTNADIIIGGTVTKYLIEMRPHFWNNTFIVYSEAKITVTNTSSLKESLSKIYRGTYETKNLLNPRHFKEGWKNALYESVTNLVRDFTIDSEFIDALKDVGKAN